jgi:hypothetical protein
LLAVLWISSLFTGTNHHIFHKTFQSCVKFNYQRDDTVLPLRNRIKIHYSSIKTKNAVMILLEKEGGINCESTKLEPFEVFQIALILLVHSSRYHRAENIIEFSLNPPSYLSVRFRDGTLPIP